MAIKIVLHVLKDGNKNSNVSFMVNYWPSQPQKGRNVFEEDINFCMNVGMTERKLGRAEGFLCRQCFLGLFLPVSWVTP